MDHVSTSKDLKVYRACLENKGIKINRSIAP